MFTTPAAQSPEHIFIYFTLLTRLQAERQARAKAEKIQLALEKMKEAAVKKVS